jgi:hypothetical protein
MSRFLLGSCVLLTILVVFVAARIEYLNVQAGYALPRHPSDEIVPRWEVPDTKVIQDHIDSFIFKQREQMAFMATSQDPSVPITLPSYGAPYNSFEQRYVNSMQFQFAMFSKLHWWVYYFGMPQYFLAPLALLLAVVCLVCESNLWSKSFSCLCALLSCSSVLLMYTRGYWHALGV